MSKSRLKLFLENFLFYGGLSMLTKAFPLIMLPVVTRLLPDASSYGIADMFNVISNFGSQIALLGMYDAMFREFFERPNDPHFQKKVTSTAFTIVFVSAIVIATVVFLSSGFLDTVLLKSDSSSWVIKIAAFMVVVSALRQLMQAPCRMRNQRKIFLFIGIGSPVLTYSILLLFVFWGYTFEAIIFSSFFGFSVLMFFFLFFNRRDFSFNLFDRSVAKELFKIGLPLVPSFLAYWIFTSTDRIVIARTLDLEQLGVYSVGVRMASVSQLVYTAFSSGWQYFSFSTMKDDDQVELTSKIFMYLSVVSLVVFILSLPFVDVVFDLLFEGSYKNGAVVFPFLFISPLLLLLFQSIGNQFLIIKKSYYSPIILAVGALVNLVATVILTSKFGIIGASIGTMLGYFVSVIMAFFVLKKLKQIVVYNNIIVLLPVVFVFLITLILLFGPLVAGGFGITCLLLCLYFYRNNVYYHLKQRFQKEKN